MIIRTSEQEINQYFEDEEHINQGGLKALLGGVYSYKEYQQRQDKQEEEHFIIGSAVDTMLTQGENAFSANFYISALSEKPSDAIMAILKETFDIAKQSRTDDEIALMAGNIHLFTQEIVNAARNKGWNPKWGDEAVAKNIIAAGSAYFDELVRSNSKQILSLEEKLIIDAVVNSLKNHEMTKNFFENDEENFFVIYQKPFYSMINGVKCKALPDIVLIDSAGNLTVYDIKTMEEQVIHFPFQAQKFRYDIQASYYLEVITRYLEKNQFTIQCDSQQIKINHVIGFRFIVESKSATGTPVIYHATENFIISGAHGRPPVAVKNEDTSAPVQIIYPQMYGYQYLLDLYDWHCKNGFEIDRVIKEHDHNLIVDWNIKVL